MQVGRPTIDYDPTLPDYPTVVHALAEKAATIGGQEAISCGDRALTYAQYARVVGGYADRLAVRDVAGGRVVLLMGNDIEVAAAALAGMAARAQVSPMNAKFPPKPLIKQVEDVDPRVIVADTENADLAREVAAAARVPHVDVFGTGELAIDQWTDDAGVELPKPMPEPEDPSLIFFTGGTTGLPKGADHNHANDMAFAMISNTVWNIGQNCARALNVAPNFHIWGFGHMTISPVYMGAAVDIVPVYKPEIVLKRLEEKKITAFFGGPAAIYVGLRAHENFKKTDFTHLEFCFAGGSPCSLDLLRGWEADTGCPILEGWGMSEGAPINCNPSHGLRKPGTVGINVPRTDIDIVDLETGETVLPVGARGEVRVRGPQMISGYRNRPEENAMAFRNGWFYTGDIGVYDEDGYLTLVDRKKEMILVGGYNVYPREIDEILNAHPAIMEAAAIGVPDDFRGETVKACVALNPGMELSEEDLIAYCQENLVKYKVPTQVAFYDELPKTGPAKIDKLKLKGLR